MRRADRLFQIIQLLRNHKWMTAEQIAQRLEVSTRTIYRDMDDLSLSGVPIIAETGIGYRLDRAYNLPPITFSEAELESILLGARMVQAWSDRQMAAQATYAIERITSVLPAHLKTAMESLDILVPAFHIFSDVAQNMPLFRKAIKQQKKIHIEYQTAEGVISERIIWPLGLFFWGNVWTLVAWCELRQDYRQFRLDRMLRFKDIDEKYRANEQQSLKYYLLHMCEDE
ncbi:MAG TPA: YafY family protein [Gammaproteobacteria bacterium]